MCGLPPPPPIGDRVVDLTGVGMEIGGKRLFRGLDFSFAGGTRLGITGRNGLGKTTLLRLIMGQLEPTEGEVKIGSLTRFNYVDQARLQVDDAKTVLDEVSEGGDFVNWGETRLSVRAYLRRFLFAEDRIVTQVGKLSGGERSRLLLAKILKRGGNFLILDEPTNDLDLPTLRVLVVSHDRYFLNRVCTGILAFEGDEQVFFSEGNLDYYLEKKERARLTVASGPASAGRKPPTVASTAGPVRPKGRKLSFKEQQELAGIEAVIQASEAKVAELETRFADPEFHAKNRGRSADLLKEVETAKIRIAQLYARWEELEALRSTAG